jgi:transcriptional regulator of aromatic amino acid metabolism
VRVVSTNVAPVWPVVQRGEFLASLYYRLNVWYVNLTEPSAD